MTRLIGPPFAAALAFAGGAANAEVRVDADPSCTVVRILPNGKRIVTPPSRGAHRSHGPAYAAAASRGGASSSVSVSSSSGGNGRSVSSSSASVNGRGATVTTTHDENGCTVTIDRRRGARR